MRKLPVIALYIYFTILTFQAFWMLVDSWLPSRMNIVSTYFVAMLAVIMLINNLRHR